jgi:hypothetical protein
MEKQLKEPVVYLAQIYQDADFDPQNARHVKLKNDFGSWFKSRHPYWLVKTIDSDRKWIKYNTRMLDGVTGQVLSKYTSTM